MDGITLALENEHALVARATVEPAAFAALYDHYFARVYSYIRYRVQDAAAADDVTAQVFERVLVRIRSYRPEKAPFAAWLFAIARHAVRDHLRAQRRRRWLSLDALDGKTSPESQPEDIALHNETCDQLLAAVARLDNRERDLIALKFGAGLTNRHIAAITGLAESNVGVILYRAIRQLRLIYTSQEQDHE